MESTNYVISGSFFNFVSHFGSLLGHILGSKRAGKRQDDAKEDFKNPKTPNPWDRGGPRGDAEEPRET